MIEARVREAEQKTALSEVHEDVIATLSHGFRQRVGVAQALVHKPALLILDEPTSGLDPNQIREMRNLIRGLKGEHTVLLSSHILTEVSQTCDRLLIIDEGKLVAQGTEAELSKGSGAAVEIEIGGGTGSTADKAKTALAAVEGVRGVDIIGPTQLRVQAAPDLRPALVRALVGANVDLLRIDRAASQLESIFTELTA